MQIQSSDQVVDQTEEWSDDQPHPYRPTKKYTGIARSSFYIPVRDGTRLAADLYLPASPDSPDKFPAILLQTRYWRSIAYRPEVPRDPADPLALEKMSSYKRRFLAQGYAWMDLDARGTGASFGFRTAEFSPDEVRDGADIVDWIIRQPWSNGKVGALGMSYEGTTAELLLVNRHPAVKAAAPMFSLFDAYADVAFPGGIRADWFLDTWGTGNAVMDRNEVPATDQAAILGVRPVDEDADGSLLAAAVLEHAKNVPLRRQLESITFRDDPSPAAAIDSIDALSPSSMQEDLAASGAAIYSISGWFDGAYAHSAIKRFLSLPNPGSKLLLGPWNHGGSTNISPFGGGPAGFDLPGELLKFFDFHLQGIQTGIDREKAVHSFRIGAERWQGGDSWPPQAQTTPYYFHSDHRLYTAMPDSVDGSDWYQVDAGAGTGQQTRWNSLIGMPLETPYPDRSTADQKCLCYTSSPLEQARELGGHALLNLFVQVNQPEADFFVYLEDIDPHGAIFHVSEGLLRGSLRAIPPETPPYHSPVSYRSFVRNQVQPIQPGETVELVIDLLPTRYVFQKGHCIRVALAGADKDHFAPPAGQPPTWRVLRSAQYPSHILLPLVPGG
jgi:putative CocE/NonD family hydrolase